MLKQIDLSLIFVPVLVFVAGVYSVLSYPPDWWVNLVYDDGYYYLGIARSLVADGRSWFLPPFVTNGYQPLWQVVLWASASVFGISDISLVLQVLCLTMLFVVLFCVMSRIRYGFLAPAVVVTVNSAFDEVALRGLETCMLPLFALGYFSSRDWRLKGVFASLLFLTRLDALALVAAADFVNTVADRRVAVRHYLILVPVVAAYAALNLFFFQTPVPVSGLMKSVGNVPGENLRIVVTFLPKLTYVVLIVAALALVAAANGLWPKLRYRREIASMVLVHVIVGLYYGVMSGWPLWGWYFWPSMLLAYYVLLELMHVVEAACQARGSLFQPRLLVPLLAAVALVGVKPAGVLVKTAQIAIGPRSGASAEETYGSVNVQLAEEFKRQGLPADTYFAMGDRSGSFGFFLGNGYRFFQTEGLVGPMAYYLAMRTDRGADFLETQPIRFFITDRAHYLEEGDTIGVMEPIQALSSRIGPYLLCFSKSAIVWQRTYGGSLPQQRYVFDFPAHVACPATMQADFLAMRSKARAVRSFSLNF
ncbi:hypothetical protein [Hartmannibacter diazotrophicus]|uniref:hypothetical protein n=1 Tax=Hartmannibacter diazotrophicus TaxID=1482074 RepID=UPI000C157DB7|nr:hypothetical protein [Hartmannibacter diazotrophicus]